MDITILAVSKRLNGVCIAGVNNGRWIRSVKKEELMLDDIKIHNGYITALNTYDFHLLKRVPVQCQSENYLIDESWQIRHKSSLVDNEKRRLFQALCENSLIIPNKNIIADILKARNRSLIMLGPAVIHNAYFHKEDGKMKAPEIMFSVNDLPIKGIKDSLLCTDLKFWAFAKSLLNHRNTDSILLDGNELKRILGFDKAYIIIGLTKLHKGINWPMIIGIHTLPDYNLVYSKHSPGV